MAVKTDLSIIIPVYFNEESIRPTYLVLKDQVLSRFPGLSFEIIFIDDGSKDKSYEEMSALAALDERVRLIQFTRNFGQVSAFYAGYEAACGKAILNLAADLQEPPELIISMIESYLRREAQIIAGKRMGRDESFYRRKTSHLFYYLMRRLSFPNMPNGGFDVVLIDEQVKTFILHSNECNPFWQGQILWSGYSVKFVSYHRQKRETGRSRWTFNKKIKYLLDGVLNYSYAPLRFFSALGIFTFILGIIYTVIIVISYLLDRVPFEGWAPLMIVILLFSGLQLVVLGIIGEYLWRVFEQIKNRPRFIVKDRENDRDR